MTKIKSENQIPSGNDTLDLLKFVLSFLIVAIHVNPFGNMYQFLRWPICRLAVPLFFLMSSYFLFQKLFKLESSKADWAVIQFVKRNLQYYFAWFIVLLPCTIAIRNYFNHGYALGLYKIIIGGSLGQLLGHRGFFLL